jgi:phosphatidate cytidylyltransferase
VTAIQVHKKSDLGVRTASAVVMMAVAGTALILGGLWLDIFIGVIALAVLVEFSLLVLKATDSPVIRIAAFAAGILYVGVAMVALTALGGGSVLIIGSVVSVDVFAYFAGRKFGGPKIAPSISPSKTWAGLIGGVVGASIFLTAAALLHNAFYGTEICQSFYDYLDSLKPPLPAGTFTFDHRCFFAVKPIDFTFAWQILMIGMLIAVVAQSGDFLESWMKRRAGVKDSSSVIPGHGGLFDRTDGMIAVAFVIGVIMLVTKQIFG